MMDRRKFLASSALVGAASLVPHRAVGGQSPGLPILKPARLVPGQVVGLVNPAGATYLRQDVEYVKDSLAALGLNCVEGKHLLDRYGYLAGTDEARADDVNALFRDDAINAIMAVRGGWGCARILPLLDYAAIRKNPKILCGYSDITALLVAIHARTGLVTFHGPDGISTWDAFSVEIFKRVLFSGEMLTMQNPKAPGDNLAPSKDRIETITPGIARGPLIGGNLSVLAGIVGSSYLPSWEGAILFLEDVGEEIYRVDRMLTQLRLAGILDRLGGFIFGKCSDCTPGEGYGSLTLPEVLSDHVASLKIPAWSGAMIGHIESKFTLPIGLMVEIDAAAGTIHLLEPAVA
jgi:muramoyltetrapeptide carboxypeptidase